MISTTRGSVLRVVGGVFATPLNAIIVLLLLILQQSSDLSVVTVVNAQRHPVAVDHVQQQQEGLLLVQTGGQGRCGADEQECLLRDGAGGLESGYAADADDHFTTGDDDEQFVDDARDDENGVVTDDEEDPMLRLLPGTDRKVYVRADIASFYRKQEPRESVVMMPEPARQPKLTVNLRERGGDSTIQRREQEESDSMMVPEEKTPKFQGQAGKFVNMSPERVQLYWNGGNGKPLVFIANIGPFQAGGTATFPTHQFLLTKHGAKQDDVLCDFLVQKGTAVYYYDPFLAYNETDGDVARCVPRANYSDMVRNVSDLSLDDQEKYQAHVYNLEFGALYKNFTGGADWLSMFPRNPPRHKIYRADYFGQQHVVSTREVHFVQEPPELAIESAKKSKPLFMDEMRRNDSDPMLPFAKYRQPGSTMNLTLTAISCAPRAFEIQNFLSYVEVDHILALVAQQHLERSTTGGHLSDTRTSTTAWIPRHSDHIVNAVIRRAADVLRLDEALMRNRDEYENPAYMLNNNRKINEDLQIVHYDAGQEYTAHHDFGYYNGIADSPTRSINVAMYLNDVEAGGETIFPRWRNAETSDALKIKPSKGKAIIFFMTLPDGNLDDLTQHAALPVIRGEKFFANLWLHDPYNR